MPSIHEIATISSKGQITLPKSIRQALSVSEGSKVAFDLRGSEIIVSRAEDEQHEDPAIMSFLSFLEKDIQSGRHLSTLPEDLARAMLAASKKPMSLADDIEGDVSL